ncbi:MAG: hypothetical protein ACQEVA_18785 [Myxococcota bacterium]
MVDRSKALDVARRVAVDGRDPDEVLECLELAAALGPEVATGEWEAAGRQLGLQCGEALLEGFLAAGVARGSVRAWSLADPELVDELGRSSSINDRWERQRAACAQALYDFHPVQSPEIAARRVVHLLEAGKTEEALEPLLLAEQYYYDKGEYTRAEALLDEYDQILDAQGVPDDVEERGRSAWRRGRLLFTQGAVEEARELSETAERVLGSSQNRSERGQAALFAGRLLRDAGDMTQARKKLQVAVESFAAAGDKRGLALSRAGLGMVLLAEGEAGAAVDAFRKARSFFETQESSHVVASILIYMAQAWHYQDDRLQAMTCIERAREVAQSNDDVVNEAATWNFEGEVARDNSDWSYARRCYRRASQLYGQIGASSEHIARFNTALVDIGAGDYASADDMLSDLERTYDQIGFGARLPLVYAARIVALIGLDRFEDVHDNVSKLDGALVETGVVHHDILEQLERARTLLDPAEQSDILEQLEEIAEVQRAALS